MSTRRHDGPELEEQLDRMRSEVEELDVRLRRLVQARPMVAVGVAVAVGYVLGRLLARR
ncbi:MAG TPA: hypothetical protein VMH82_02575 [Myxococcota bacterium]|nr:hypothetical protein [Myxococcota bacterium]